MTFGDMLASDIKDLFFDDSEFATYRLYNGKKIKVVEDDDSLVRKYSSEFEALPSGSHMILVPEGEIRRPGANDVVNYSGDLYIVDEVKVEMGLYVIFLKRGRF